MEPELKTTELAAPDDVPNTPNVAPVPCVKIEPALKTMPLASAAVSRWAAAEKVIDPLMLASEAGHA